MSGAHRAAGPRHRRRPQRPGGLPGAAVGAAAAGRVARRGAGAPAPAATTGSASGSGSPRRPRTSCAYESRTWRLTDDGAIVGPDAARVRLPGAPAGEDDVELLVTSPDGLVEIYVGRARTTTSWELATDVLARTPDAPDVSRAVRLYGIVEGALLYAIDRAGRRRPLRPPCPPDSNGSDDPARSATRPATPRQVADAYVDAVCDLDPIVATSLGTRPGDDRLPDPSPAGLEAEAELTRAARSPSWTGCSPTTRPWTTTRSSGAAPGCCASGSAAELAAARGGRGPPRQLSNLFSPGALDPPGLLA